MNYDYWHGIIPLVAIALLGFITAQMEYVGLAALALITLQAMNESFQSMRDDIPDTYGSYEAFQKNSKRDWVYFFIGLTLGFVVYGIIAGVMF